MSKPSGATHWGVQLCATPIIWKNVILMSLVHLVTLYVFVRAYQGEIALRTVAFFWLYAFWNAFGILAGAHRLWSHKSYKARLPLRVLLMCMQTASLQNDLYDWCRNHRLHHRYSETNADPHNSRRGFFFAHMGWLMCRKHPDVKEYGKNVNMDDILADPVVRFQKRHYYLLVFLIWFLLPVSISMVLFKETFVTSFLVNCWRYVISLHNTWLVNSLAHLEGSKPYNKNIEPRENKIVAYFSLGEGYHNYHHTFPWDYSASELGWRRNYNFATAFIDFFSWIGLAYDLKVPSYSMVVGRLEKHGDGTLSIEHLVKRQRENGSLSWLVQGFKDSLVGFLTVSWPVWTVAVARVLQATYAVII